KTRISFGIGADAFVAGCVATFRPVKGLDVLVRTAAIVKQSCANVCFLFVGDGPELPEMQKLSAQLGVNDYCVFAGAHRDVLPFLSAFDIGVLPSHSEGFSNSLLEYMAAGLPVIATDVGGNRETVEETALLVPPNNAQALANAILSLISSPDLRERLGIGARSRVRSQFDLETAGNQLHRYFRNLAARRGAINH